MAGSVAAPWVPISATSGATAIGPASPAAQASSSFSLNAISMVVPQEKGPVITGPSSRLVGVGGRDIGRGLHLRHQIVVPLAFDLEVRGGAEVGGLDQIVRNIGVDAGLHELVQRSARRAAADEPGLEPRLRRVGELAGLPDIIALAADQMRTAVAVGLRMHDQHVLADIGW